MVSERKNGVNKTIKDRSGLGRAIINRRAKAAKIAADPTLVCTLSFDLYDTNQPIALIRN